MSAPASSGGAGWQWLPERLRPREREDPGLGTLRLIETTLLVIAIVILAVATINDVGRQVNINVRLNADARAWRDYTGHDYHNLLIDQQLYGPSSQREVVCGNTSPGAPKARTQICLMVWGPTRDGRREVHGGWYLPPGAEDERSLRYGCFGGAVAAGMCPR
jgi:hypothetical protein